MTAVMTAGCAGEEDKGSVLEWQGETPHLLVQGRLNGEDIVIDVNGEDAATGSGAWCAREYEAPVRADDSLDLARATYTATEISGFATINGEERSFALELRDHALHSDEIGASLSVVPADSTEPAGAGEVQIDWEWHVGEVDLFEASAQEGHIALELFTGAPGEGGVVIPSGEGAVGGVIEARWALDESLSVSFTLPCVETEVEGL